MVRSLLLTFDTEEFDVPRELGFNISEKEQLEIGARGAKAVLALLDRYKLKATFFVTGYFAEHNEQLVKDIAKKHEIALHGAKHSDNYKTISPSSAAALLSKTRKRIEKLIGKPVLGFRAPRFQAPPASAIKAAGFRYDSSLHPTYVPGRYNNLTKPRKPFVRDGITIIPISVSPITRLPFSWVWFRLLSLPYTKLNSLFTLSSTNTLHLYFHPWEFIDLGIWKTKLPKSIVGNTGKRMIQKFEDYIRWCMKKECRSMTLSDYITQLSHRKQ